MSQLTFVLGNSGTGKSTSLRNFTKKDGIGYVTATGKPLPFKSDIPQLHAKSYADLMVAIQNSKAPIIVIDDFNYFMTFEEFSKASIKGYDKFTEMAVNVVNVIEAITTKESDQRFYILAHTESSSDKSSDFGQLKLKTTGKMVSDKFVPEGLTNQVIETAVIDKEFVFKVKTDGTGIKTPMGMFDTDTIPNDLRVLDEKIKAFYA
jgi:hypothetical protein